MAGLTPATYLDRLIQEYAEQPPAPMLPPPRQYMTPGMEGFEMDMNGLPVRKGEAQPQPSNVLPPPSQVAQQAQQPQTNRRPDEARRIR